MASDVRLRRSKRVAEREAPRGAKRARRAAGAAAAAAAAARPKPTVLLAHGAGAGHSSAWLRAWAARLEPHCAAVVPLTFGYMARAESEGRRIPPSPFARLVDEHVEAVRRVQGDVVLVGKSMGSRTGAQALARLQEAGDPAARRVRACVCLGFPLRSLSGRRAVRSETLLALGPGAPVLLVSGTRDKMAPAALLRETAAGMRAPVSVMAVPDGDHSLAVTRRSGIAQDASDDAVERAIAALIGRLRVAFV